MEEELISYETAKLAKEKGFNWPVVSSYNDEGDTFCKTKPHDWNIKRTAALKKNPYCSAPTQSLLQKWLREIHNLQININYHHFGIDAFNGTDQYMGFLFRDHITTNDSHEDALEYVLNRSLALIK